MTLEAQLLQWKRKIRSKHRKGVKFSQKHSEKKRQGKKGTTITNNPCSEFPTFTVTRMGIVRVISACWSNEKMSDSASVPVGYEEIIKGVLDRISVLMPNLQIPKLLKHFSWTDSTKKNAMQHCSFI